MATQIAATPTIYGEEARKIMREAKTTQSKKSNINARKLTEFFDNYMNTWKQNNDSMFKDIQFYNAQELDGRTLKIIVNESKEGILIGGKDIETDKIYIISYLNK